MQTSPKRMQTANTPASRFNRTREAPKPLVDDLFRRTWGLETMKSVWKLSVCSGNVVNMLSPNLSWCFLQIFSQKWSSGTFGFSSEVYWQPINSLLFFLLGFEPGKRINGAWEGGAKMISLVCWQDIRGAYSALVGFKSVPELLGWAKGSWKVQEIQIRTELGPSYHLPFNFCGSQTFIQNPIGQASFSSSFPATWNGTGGSWGGAATWLVIIGGHRSTLLDIVGRTSSIASWKCSHVYFLRLTIPL